jgi:hypothetical protein
LEKYTFKYVNISYWSFAQIILPAGLASQWVLNKNCRVWIDGAIPPPEVPAKMKCFNNFLPNEI